MTPAAPITPSQFCSYFTSKCGTSYSSMSGAFANEAECVSRYTGYSDGQKRCVGYHLCIAGAGATSHCSYPSAVGGTDNPCGL